jgi:hypothetical protein
VDQASRAPLQVVYRAPGEEGKEEIGAHPSTRFGGILRPRTDRPALL